ncbi:murein DD-endopeptidase MepM/ murein hydrolase activator NlpD [Wenyingzhuangia heitensis]|uniref:Murein DD-endopeptidase MepM/ murein hydrolase activator NlpD n=1 Tax=Wenyingzhuangia heitensis TaxID=1487859 RepID=A0ABX0UB50_9FLAO|nr:M23 family metallopeptidase [Wenyingzhuangia heitensis]NIJ45055.1 murein DD-endopeptidase MepM/ murein hydrolase activator NlpD [Wenyingzhuangia heitensis]
MKSPTNKIVLRGNDPTGYGYYGASRSNGTRKHEGTDYCATPGENIYACISGKVRVGVVYSNSTKMKLVEITGADYRVKQMYVQPNVKTGDFVKEGDCIGTSQDISAYWGGNMLNHVHISVWKHGLLTDPEPIIKE